MSNFLGFEKIAEVFGQGGADANQDQLYRMGKMNFRCVKGVPFQQQQTVVSVGEAIANEIEIQSLVRAIDLVSHNRMAQGGHMYP